MAKRSTKNLPVGEQIRLMRLKRELSQSALRAEVARKDGKLSKGGLSQLEAGERYPNLATLESICRALKCSIVITGKQTYIPELAES